MFLKKLAPLTDIQAEYVTGWYSSPEANREIMRLRKLNTEKEKQNASNKSKSRRIK